MTRKTSLPYPSSPPDPFVPSPPNLLPDTADIPPVPSALQRGPIASHNSAFSESDNPWKDASSRDWKEVNPVPDILKPGSGRPAEGGKVSSINVPRVLKPGRPEQDTPRSSLSSEESRGFWEDDDDEEEGNKENVSGDGHKGRTIAGGDPPHTRSPDNGLGAATGPSPSPEIKRKPVPALASFPTPNEVVPAQKLASNNPFRRASSLERESGLTPQIQPSRPDWSRDNSHVWRKGEEVDRGRVASAPTGAFQQLMLTSSAAPDWSSYNNLHNDQNSTQVWQHNDDTGFRPPAPQGPPPPVPQPLSPYSEQPPLIPVSPEADQTPNPWAAESQQAATISPPVPLALSQKQASNCTEDLLDHGQQTGVVFPQDTLEVAPHVEEPNAILNQHSSLLDDEADDVGPPLPSRPAVPQSSTQTEGAYEPPEGPPPAKPPRPTIRMTIPSDEEVARMIEQRNETYQIKHFNWFDHNSRTLRRSSMLIQNHNGPCPLLALVNALILGVQHESQAALDDALRAREQVSLGLIIETLMDELLSRGYQSGEGALPDVDELNGFLMRLRTGMNANPRFVPPARPVPNLMDADSPLLDLPQAQRAQWRTGSFEATLDLKLYGAFSVPLVHGWLPDPESDAATAFGRSAPTYEDAQALQFGEEELEYKLSRGGLTPEEQQVWEDINSIKNFLKLYPTQLTPYGLEAVQESIPSGSFAILFRNDHFSTVYKHPDSGQLFTLITDAGYADRDEIIWESLVDISGKNNEFFSGDFMPVSHDESASGSGAGRPGHARHTSQQLGVPSVQTPMSPKEQQEQHDADFAMALQLQEEEEQRERAEQARRRSGNAHPRRSTGNIPIPIRSQQQPQQQQQQEVRPLIPPRNGRSGNPGVNRPVDPDDADAPPAYEEAARGKPYIPPLGSPLHPSAEPSPMNSTTQLTGVISNTSVPQADPHPPGPNATPGRRHPHRRMSAYTETSQYYGTPLPSQGVGTSTRPATDPRQDRDCVVM